MQPNSRSHWLLLLAIVFIGAGWIWLTRAPNAATQAGPPPAPKEGFSAPDFSLQTLTGETLALHDLRGKVVLLNFWATWCAPCKAEMPALQRVYTEKHAQGLEILAVTVETDTATVSDFTRRYGIGFPVLLDARAAVSRKYHIQGTPTTFFIDRKGIIRSVIVGGPMSEGLIRSKVDDLLKEETP